MKVMVDTNVLISASLGFGTPYKAYEKAVTAPYQCVICDQIVDEMRRVYNRKFPDKVLRLEQFLAMVLTALEVVPTPTVKTDEETLIRDPKDSPILKAAINANVDILVTGDKDFLESAVTHPRIMTAAEFLGLERSLP